MKNDYTGIFEYLDWRGDLSFEDAPLNPVDLSVMCQLTYLNLDGLLDDDFKKSVSISELHSLFISSSNYAERCEMGVMINPKNPELLERCAVTSRFADLQVTGYKSIFEDKKDIQFAALTFKINKKLNVIVFRGTDDSIAGWKEDFDLCYKEEIPSQTLAVEYENKAFSSLKGEFILSGHSKGGNIVLYAAVKCPAKNQNKIKAVYDFDGPGFSKDFYETEAFKKVEKKLTIIYPEFDIVGMLFHHPEGYKIIKSEQQGALQHDMMSWKVCGADFIYGSDFTNESKVFGEAMNGWVDNLSLEDRSRFVNTLFGIIRSTGAVFNRDFEKNMLPYSAKMLGEFVKLDGDTRDNLKKVISILVKAFRDALPMFNSFNLTKGIPHLSSGSKGKSKQN